VKPDADVMTRLAMPYNPYEPEPYSRWTDGGLYDFSHGEILVGKEFWNHVGRGDVYDDLLDIFSQAGEQVRKGLDKRWF
jgi:type II restriction enzyme